jgi:DNA-binding beta-propeller fold protein YncE
MIRKELLILLLGLMALIFPAKAEVPTPFLLEWGSYGTAAGQFNAPKDIAFDAAGNVFVADQTNYRIQSFTSTGDFITSWGSGHFTNKIFGVAVDPNSGYVYVADTQAQEIEKFTTDGTFITKWGSYGSGNGQFRTPSRVAVDGSGNVYVADTDNHRIQKFTESGAFITKWGSYGTGNGQFNRPFGLAIDASNNVYVVDMNNHRIQKFTESGAFITKWGSHGSGHGQFKLPRGAAVDGNGDVYVADTDNHRIQKFTESGSFITKWGSGVAGSAQGQFHRPTEVGIGESDDLYVADWLNHRIQRFGEPPVPPDTEYLTVEVYAKFGIHVGSISFDDEDNLYVGNFNLPGLDADPAHVWKVASIDGAVTAFGQAVPDPDALVVDRGGFVGSEGSVLVGGAPSGCPTDCVGIISEISSDGSVTQTLHSGGCLGNIQDLDFDSTGRLYVLNYNRGTVCIVEGGNVSEFLSLGNALSTLVVDPDDDIYVSSGGLVQKYSSAGTIQDPAFTEGAAVGFGPPGIFEGLIVSRAGSLFAIDPNTKEERLLLEDVQGGSIAFDSVGDMFISQRLNQRVLRVTPAFGAVEGQVTADCLPPGDGLSGVTVDAYEVDSGNLVASAVTNENGSYQIPDLWAGDFTITLVTPLGYRTESEDVPVSLRGGTVRVDFELECLEITSEPRGGGYWRHEVAVATGGHGNAHLDEATLCEYLDLVVVHFNNNQANPVVIYEPASDLCEEKLETAKALLSHRGRADMVDKATRQLMAMLLNVVSGSISQATVISEDGATMSQAITYCDWLIDDPNGDHEQAKDIGEMINNGTILPADLIPLTVPNHAYDWEPGVVRMVPTEFELEQNHPNPFLASTTIRLSLPESRQCELSIYDLSGRLVRRYAETSGPGVISIIWDGKDEEGDPVSAGLYFYAVQAGESSETKKMVVLK